MTVHLNRFAHSTYRGISRSACQKLIHWKCLRCQFRCATFSARETDKTIPFSLPSNFLCLETNVVLILWLLFSTKFSNSSLLCWLSLSSISDVQQVYPWGQTRRCSPKGDTHRAPFLHTSLPKDSVFPKAALSHWSNSVILWQSSLKLSKRNRP